MTKIRPFGRAALAAPVVLMLFVLSAAAATPAAVDTLVVRPHRAAPGDAERAVDPAADLAGQLRGTALALIRKGAGCVSDVYADGFKRSDLTVAIDGERHTTACPNRMDTRVGQVNFLLLDRVDVSRAGGALQNGLGGRVAYTRRPIGEETRVLGRLAGAFAAADETDAALVVESKRTRGSVRWRRGGPWTDGDGTPFAATYGYALTPDHSILELQAARAWGTGDASAGYETSTDVLFPYLKMDERENDHYEISASHRGWRAYLNRNEHLMDNGLRTSLASMDMVTDATNTTAGVVGRDVELWVRNWDADNTITPTANPMMAIHNHMLPDVTRVGAQARRAVDLSGNRLELRLGLIRTSAGADDTRALTDGLFPGHERTQWSVPAGLTLGRDVPVAAGTLSLALEAAADAPSPEQMFIAVDKPMTTPTWLGNPELADPVRGTLRAAWRRAGLTAELFATHVWGYPYLRRTTVATQAYLTYGGIDAVLLGANLGYRSELLDASLVWNHGEKSDDGGPLAEIRPLQLTMEGRTPERRGVHAFARITATAKQDRVDATLNEWTTDSWTTFDLGAEWRHGPWRWRAEVANVADEAYAQHLSFVRDPFAAGVPVFEPGRSLRLVGVYGL
ncbi:MAG TPA: TonB-dependent receptor [Candidatus Krumholzibacteria bacterium]|nr:TonB-dependent receptor [Candidatus Krumholzibacteria bacterium]